MYEINKMKDRSRALRKTAASVSWSSRKAIILFAIPVISDGSHADAWLPNAFDIDLLGVGTREEETNRIESNRIESNPKLKS